MIGKMVRRHTTARRLAGTAGLLLILSSADMPPAAAGPLDCARIGEAAARLACFDAEYPRAMLLPPEEATGKWQLQAAPSAVSHRTDHTISLASQSMVQCRWTDPRPVELRIRCLSNVTSVFLETGCYMASGTNRADGDVSFQIEDSETSVARMTAGPDGRSLGFWSGDRAIPFIRALLGKSVLSVRMTPHSDDPISAVFDLRGIDTAIAPARTACGW